MAILDENEFTEVEGRSYLNPQVALDESNAFIDNLRSTQQANNRQIQTDTYNLGTDISSNLGGLTGAESYFTSRYQTPQTNAAVANLRATAQAAALNDVLANEQAIWKKRYQDAYRVAQRRARAGGGGGGGATPPSELPIGGGVDEVDTTSTVVGVVPGAPGGYTVGNIIPDWGDMTSDVIGYTYVPYGQDGKVNYVYGGGGSSSGVSQTTRQLTPTNRLTQNNPLPSWGVL